MGFGWMLLVAVAAVCWSVVNTGCYWHQASTYDEDVYSNCTYLGKGPQGLLSDCKNTCCQTAGCNTINYSDDGTTCYLKSCGTSDLKIKPSKFSKTYAVHTMLDDRMTISRTNQKPSSAPKSTTSAVRNRYCVHFCNVDDACFAVGVKQIGPSEWSCSFFGQLSPGETFTAETDYELWDIFITHSP